MFKTVKDLRNLQFPLYPIHSDNWYQQDGLTYVETSIVDDRNKPGNSIGLRRLQSGRKNLYKLRNPAFYVKDLITSRKKHFISSCGVPFTYEKTGFQHIKYHEIKRFDLRDDFTFVWLRDITIPLEIPRPPPNYKDIPWARILYYNQVPWLVYEFSYSVDRTRRIKV